MTKHVGKIVGVIAIAVILVGVGWYTGFFENAGTANLGKQTVPKVEQTEVITGDQDYQGNLNLSTKAYDTLDGTIQYGDDTEVDTICYQRVGDDVKDWKELGRQSEAETGDSNIDVKFDMTEMWCNVEIETSLEYYVDAQRIVKNNDAVDTFIWGDPDDNNVDSYVFRVDLTGIKPSQSGSEASMTLTWYLYDEETSDSVLDTATASLTSVPTGETSKQIKFNIDLDTSTNGADAKYIQGFRIRFNSTDDTNWNLSKSFITMPDGTQITLAKMQETVLSSTIEYKYTIPVDPTSYAESYLLSVPKDGNNEFDIPLTLSSNLASNEALCVELGVRYIDGYGTISAYDTDDVEYTNVSSVGDECSL